MAPLPFLPAALNSIFNGSCLRNSRLLLFQISAKNSKMYRSYKFSILVTTLFFISPIHGQRCTKALQCDDGDDATIDMCHPILSVCLQIMPQKLSTLLTSANTPALSLAEKRAAIDISAQVFQEINVNVQIYKSLYSFDIASALRGFAQDKRLSKLSNVQFHQSMATIFRQAHDLHCVYAPPPPFPRIISTLKFKVSIFYTSRQNDASEKPRRRYMVSDLSPSNNSTLRLGAEILSWNGIPVDRAVRALGCLSYGSNDAARIARGVDLLTFRSFVADPIPKYEPVQIVFRLRGVKKAISMPWSYGDLEASLGATPEMQILSRMHQSNQIFPLGRGIGRSSDPNVIGESVETFNSSVRTIGKSRITIPLKPEVADFFTAEIIKTKSGRIGRIVLPSFAAAGDTLKSILKEMARVLKLMPRKGLIMDVRGNVGGSPEYVRAVAELYIGQDKSIDDQPIILRGSNITRQFIEGSPAPAVRAFVNIIKVAVQSALMAGERYSGPIGNIFTIVTEGTIERPKR